MTRREAALKSVFTKRLKLELPDFLVLHYASAGAPDREIVGNGATTRWEMKHGTPGFASSGIQELLCMRLAARAHCRYVIWQERAGERRTLIAHPRAVHERRGWRVEAEAWCEGFDHGWLVDRVREAHRK